MHVEHSGSQKHLVLILDTQLNFQQHLKTVFKENITLGPICKLKDYLTRPFLLTLYKSFVISHLDNGDIINDQSYNNSFQNKNRKYPIRRETC